MSLFKLVGEVFVDTKQAEDSLGKTEEKTVSLAKKFESAGTTIKKAGEKISKAGTTLTKKVTLPIVGSGTASVKMAADFEANMSKVSALSGATGKDLDDLKQKAMDLGYKSKFSSVEMAEAMSYMGMAGWEAKDMLEGLDGVVNLATASGEDLATTSDIVTDALTAFGLEAGDATHFADVLAVTSADANTNVSLMGETFKYVAPVAGSLGYSIEDVGVAIGLMANSGIEGSQAGTTLRQILNNMAKPTKESAAAMEMLGVSLDDGEGNMYSFGEVMQQLREGFGEIMIPIDEFTQQANALDAQLENGEITEKQYAAAMEELTERAYGAEGAEKAKAAAMLAGQRGMSGLLAIVNATSKDYEDLTNAINNADGAAEDMATIMQDNLNGQLTRLKSATQNAAIEIGEKLTPYVSQLAGWIQSLVEKFSSLDESQKEQIIKWAGIAAAVGPVLLIIGKVVAVVGAVISAVGTMWGVISGGGTVIAALVAAFGAVNLVAVAVVAGIAAVIAIGVALWKNWDTIRQKAGQLWSNLKQGFAQLGSDIRTRMGQIKQNVVDAFTGLKEKAQEQIEKLKDFFANTVFKFPHIPVPHINISGGEAPWGLMGAGTKPNISVDWYAKAMDSPMLLKGATIFGEQNGRLLGGGEVGAEVVSGADTLMSMIREASGADDAVLMAILEELKELRRGLYEIIVAALASGEKLSKRDLARLIREYA